MENIKAYLGGRIFNSAELSQAEIEFLISIGGKRKPAIIDRKCQRCLMTIDIKNSKSKMVYCRSCINLGRITQGDELIISPSEVVLPCLTDSIKWNGTLTAMQQKAAEELITAFDTHTDHLVWAVTGAGKTEMIFPMINKAVAQGKRIAICSPRIDVCIELYPRIQAAFPEVSIGLFHGRSETPYSLTQIVLATVHQLVKFEQAFDILVVDEVDSYPLAGSKMLNMAIQKSVKPIGNTLYLSATPPKELLKKVESKSITISKLYQRFHTHPLPEPVCHMLFRPSNYKKINIRLKWKIKQMIKNGERFMLFFPKIPQMLEFADNLRLLFPNLTFVDVSSKDDARLDKVAQFRNGEVQAILTTTILERGVTFKHITVIVIDADANEFSKTALIQIAGRAGRDKKYFDDEVHFYYQSYNRQIKHACSEIHYLNRQAKI
ncbi:helicase-related protein [Companilactobacillus jidongensis]|uniref:helicase-related protein n=1 Tax=Companilactobacillus jidongensis TaxID=2486006 RepID=UPI000F7A38D7|nr:helicase-related protein [Companilactobacillus jidongensis]